MSRQINWLWASGFALCFIVQQASADDQNYEVETSKVSYRLDPHLSIYAQPSFDIKVLGNIRPVHGSMQLYNNDLHVEMTPSAQQHYSYFIEHPYTLKGEDDWPAVDATDAVLIVGAVIVAEPLLPYVTAAGLIAKSTKVWGQIVDEQVAKRDPHPKPYMIDEYGILTPAPLMIDNSATGAGVMMDFVVDHVESADSKPYIRHFVIEEGISWLLGKAPVMNRLPPSLPAEYAKDKLTGIPSTWLADQMAPIEDDSGGGCQPFVMLENTIPCVSLLIPGLQQLPLSAPPITPTSPLTLTFAPTMPATQLPAVLTDLPAMITLRSALSSTPMQVQTSIPAHGSIMLKFTPLQRSGEDYVQSSGQEDSNSQTEQDNNDDSGHDENWHGLPEQVILTGPINGDIDIERHD